MTEDMDDALETRTAVEIVPAYMFTTDLERMAPLVDALVAGFAAGRVRMTDPAERLALVDLRARLVGVIGTLTDARNLIEQVFLQYAVEQKAAEVMLPDERRVHYEAARGEYITEAKKMRVALHALASLDGTVPPGEVDEALKEEVTIKPNHSKLNALAKKYGGTVAEVINANRTFVVPPPERGRVRFPEPKP